MCSLLPPELWQSILARAACSAYSTAPPELPSNPFSSWLPDQLYRQCHSTYPTVAQIRLSLALVSRCWYHLSIHLLYEDIAVHSQSQLEKLRLAIERSVSKTTATAANNTIRGGKRHMGWYTKRLYLFEMKVPGPAEERRLHDSLSYLLRHMPMLLHFLDDGIYGNNMTPISSNNGAVVVNTLRFPSSPSLPSSSSFVSQIRTLHLRARHIHPKDMCEMLNSLPNLQILKLVQIRTKQHHNCPLQQNQRPKTSSPLIYLPNLHTLHIDSPSDSLRLLALLGPYSRLPLLSTLIISGHEVRHLDLLLRTHGPNLHTLSLQIVLTDASALSSGLSYCTDLKQLVISHYLEVPPKVFRALEGSLVRVGVEDMDELFRDEEEMRKYWPTVYARLDHLFETFLTAEGPEAITTTTTTTTTGRGTSQQQCGMLRTSSSGVGGFRKLKSIVALRVMRRELMQARARELLSQEYWIRWGNGFRMKGVRLEDALGFEIF